MTLHEKAASLSREEIVALLVSEQQLAKSNDDLTQRLSELEQRLAWLQRQVFGSKSERRIETPDEQQLGLGESFAAGCPSPVATVTIPSHLRQPAKQPWEGTPADSGLRFDPSVPVREIKIPNLDAESLPPAAYEIIGQKVTYRLAQRPGSYVVLKYVRDVMKLKSEDGILCSPAPAAVIEKSFADVSFLAGLLIDKLLYHLPLYRQHQRLMDCGIRFARATLTNLVHQAAMLLEPIYAAQLRSIHESRVLAADETPIRAGRNPGKAGKMQNGYFWPLYGDRDEVAFEFSNSRSLATARRLLEPFAGVLLSDGFSVYERYAATSSRIRRAQCWSHARRKFVEAQIVEPDLSRKALDLIGAIYAHEATIRERGLEGEKKLEFRAEHSKPAVDLFFAWLRDTLRDQILLTSNPFTKAASYALEREDALRVFLEEPEVPVDTNHLEREIRPIAIGRKNWLFCWTEIGAKHVGVVQSLLRTCRLHGVDPYTYLVDVLQRVATHPASEVHQLTPRLWKEHFAAAPLRSDVDSCQPASSVTTS